MAAHNSTDFGVKFHPSETHLFWTIYGGYTCHPIPIGLGSPPCGRQYSREKTLTSIPRYAKCKRCIPGVLIFDTAVETHIHHAWASHIFQFQVGVPRDGTTYNNYPPLKCNIHRYLDTQNNGNSAIHHLWYLKFRGCFIMMISVGQLIWNPFEHRSDNPTTTGPWVIFELRLFFDAECTRASQLTPFFTESLALCDTPVKIAIPKTNIAPENGPSQKETSIPTIHFQGIC